MLRSSYRVYCSPLKQLRNETGCPIGKCKEALVATNYDISESKIWLRMNLNVSKFKKQDIKTNAGMFAIASTPYQWVSVKLLCQTDFVALTQDFNILAMDVARDIMKGASCEIVEDKINFFSGKMGEKIVLGGETCILTGDSEFVSWYVHRSKNTNVNDEIHTQCGIGPLSYGKFKFRGEHIDESREWAKRICMQRVESLPEFIFSSEVPEERLKLEQEILQSSGKNVDRGLKLFFEQNTLECSRMTYAPKYSVRDVLDKYGIDLINHHCETLL